MYDEEVWRLTLLRFVHGPFLAEITEKLGLEKDDKWIIKEAFKKRLMIRSLGDLTARELRVWVSHVSMIMSAEFGEEVAEIGEPEGVADEDTTLQEFFHLIYDKQNGN
jgi:hypothetical protein